MLWTPVGEIRWCHDLFEYILQKEDNEDGVTVVDEKEKKYFYRGRGECKYDDFKENNDSTFSATR
jgi:hypothetical protein